jgi:ubiquinone/menaquinone biosynthesis C-methylase UbiE
MIIDKQNLTVAKILASRNLENLKVLEVGCGDGRITADLFGGAGSLTAIDPDAGSIASARERIPDADFRVGSGECLGFPDDSIDVVLFTLSLHHQNSHQALKEAARVLREYGQVLIVEPAIDSEISAICNLFNDETEVLNNAIEAINAGKFEVICVETFCVEWEFKDNQELYDWLCDHYHTRYDQTKVEKVNQLLGRKQWDRPVNLREKLVITKLKASSIQ